jgi:hypothetical protein
VVIVISFEVSDFDSQFSRDRLAAAGAELPNRCLNGYG